MDFADLFSIALGAILVNNFIFSQFLGICPFMGVSKKIDTAMGMGMAVTFVMGVASAVCWPINQLLLKLNLGFMQTVVFILVIASLVQFVEMFLQKSMPSLYQALGVYLPLITTNCAVLGVVLQNTQNNYDFLESVVYGGHRRPGLPAGHRALCQRAGAPGVLRVPQGLRGLPHRAGDRRSAGAGLPGLLRPVGILREAQRYDNCDCCCCRARHFGRGVRRDFGLCCQDIRRGEGTPGKKAIAGVLPGANCGGCGYPGCAGYAAAVAAGKAATNCCAAGGDAVAAQIAEIMGVKAEATVKEVAQVQCTGGCRGREKYNYVGISDCAAAARLPGGGPAGCSYGCLGLGTCEKVCPFDAIHVVDGVAKVDEEKCKACKKCVDACPGTSSFWPPYKTKRHVAIPCSSKDKGVVVRQVCDNGCIGCGLCAKACPRRPLRWTRTWPSSTTTSASAAACAPRSAPASSSRWTGRSRRSSPPPPKLLPRPRPSKNPACSAPRSSSAAQFFRRFLRNLFSKRLCCGILKEIIMRRMIPWTMQANL